MYNFNVDDYYFKLASLWAEEWYQYDLDLLSKWGIKLVSNWINK